VGKIANIFTKSNTLVPSRKKDRDLVPGSYSNLLLLSAKAFLLDHNKFNYLLIRCVSRPTTEATTGLLLRVLKTRQLVVAYC
jgi:hypothetical protein